MVLKNKVAIITGGSRGIGNAIAELFASEGAVVALVARSENELQSAVEKIKSDGGTAEGFMADVSKPDDAKRIVKSIAEKFGKINILVNAAAIQAPIGPFLENDSEEWIKNVAVNLFGTAFFSKEIASYMVKKGGGKIINFSGGGATSSRPNFSAYAASKAAVVRFTEVLADELKEFNVQVNAVAPGAVKTKMMEEILDAGERAGPKELENARKILSEGGTDPKLVAELVLFLASERSGGLTGRLISAVWDDWRGWDENDIEEIMNSDKYKLRRIT